MPSCKLRNLVAVLQATFLFAARCGVFPTFCAKGLPNDAPGAVYPRSGVATGVGVVCESEGTGKTDAKTRVAWSIVGVID